MTTFWCLSSHFTPSFHANCPHCLVDASLVIHSTMAACKKGCSCDCLQQGQSDYSWPGIYTAAALRTQLLEGAAPSALRPVHNMLAWHQCSCRCPQPSSHPLQIFRFSVKVQNAQCWHGMACGVVWLQACKRPPADELPHLPGLLPASHKGGQGRSPRSPQHCHQSRKAEAEACVYRGWSTRRHVQVCVVSNTPSTMCGNNRLALLICYNCFVFVCMSHRLIGSRSQALSSATRAVELHRFSVLHGQICICMRTELLLASLHPPRSFLPAQMLGPWTYRGCFHSQHGADHHCAKGSLPNETVTQMASGRETRWNCLLATLRGEYCLQTIPECLAARRQLIYPSRWPASL